MSEVERGTHIGRHVLLREIGKGAITVVFAARDPALDRTVALKLFHFCQGDPTATRTRIECVARSLAELDHPNIIRVYDVGLHHNRPFLTMDLVEGGQTLRDWMRAGTPQSWLDIVRVLAEAGRGLAAAHDVGLVHHDFNRDNVLIGNDGRVRVMDFGLARAFAKPGAEMNPTPSHMAPELIDRPGDARSDQFTFCVTLYEALYGDHPFAGNTLMEMHRAKMNQQIRAAPSDSTIPGALHALVVRGLASDPEQRLPSMSALLDAIEAIRDARRPFIRRLLGRRWP